MTVSWRDIPVHPIERPVGPWERKCDGLWADVRDMGKDATSPNALDSMRAASYLLWVMSGRRFGGICTTTENYVCPERCDGQCLMQMLELPSGRVQSFCSAEGYGSCGAQDALFLRNRPVRKIISMSRDGHPLNVDEYAVYDRAFIGLADQHGCNGGCWDPCGVEVTYEWGTYPPVLGRMAALEFAGEFVKAVECPGECKLPERITSVSRQGVSYQVFDPQDFMNEGRTGLYTVDLFLKSVNPDRAQKRSRVFNVDMPRARAKTWGG